VNAVMNLRIPQSVCRFLNGCTTGGLLSGIQSNRERERERAREGEYILRKSSSLQLIDKFGNGPTNKTNSVALSPQATYTD
jgi:hypothetical protein